MEQDTFVKCARCGTGQQVDFAGCLSEGWPVHCGEETMVIAFTIADVDVALAAAVREFHRRIELVHQTLSLLQRSKAEAS